mgnify:CR=1 FL=1
MSKFTAENIRNFALIGHSGEGKTSLAEAILFNAGAIDRMGTTNDGTSVMDFDAEEIAKKSSIGLATSYCEYKGYKFNLIDVNVSMRKSRIFRRNFNFITHESHSSLYEYLRLTKDLY